ncbi:winged helix-turn-helix transcriptional regulator [Arcticibacter tournemirensis]|uniref:Winged helix-turn-helix transcriptional regulator n=1 Tax=Arcticibacter tournemirensis TaxID=699437 RepID=A0A5M9GXS7_9SPHI|nr:winged helix-turn-helix transcriptional regulator [Arcticibacter tournemirensis]
MYLEIVKILYHHRFRSLSRKELLIQAWGNDDFFSSRSMDVFISKLRRYLTLDPRIRIINQKGVGYKLIC